MRRLSSILFAAMLVGCSDEEPPEYPNSCDCPPNTVCDTRGDCVAPCADDDVCTECEACQSGRCVPAACRCTGDGDCDDGLFCNGAETCGGNGRCVPGTPLSCAPPTNTCFDNVCDEETDGCALVGNRSCACDGPQECDDGLDCSGVEECVGGFCEPGVPHYCAPSTVTCQRSVCLDGVGGPSCVLEPDAGAPCDDETPCTDAVCNLAGTCVGTPVDCDDGISCTTDACDPGPDECVNTPDHGACADSTDCTVDTCDLVLGCTSEPSDARCSDADPCTADVCDAVTGCSSTPIGDGQPCDNGCTTGGTCQGGVCQESGTNTCTSSQVCVFGSCWDGSEQTLDSGTGCDDRVYPRDAIVWDGHAEVALEVLRIEAASASCPARYRAMVVRMSQDTPSVVANIGDASAEGLGEYLLGYFESGAPLLGVRDGGGFLTSGTPLHAALPGNVMQLVRSSTVSLCDSPCTPADERTITSFAGRYYDAGYGSRVFSCRWDPTPVCNIEHMTSTDHFVPWDVMMAAVPLTGGEHVYAGILVSTNLVADTAHDGSLFGDPDMDYLIEDTALAASQTRIRLLRLSPELALAYSASSLWVCRNPPTWSCGDASFQVNGAGATHASYSSSGAIVLARPTSVAILPAGGDPETPADWEIVEIPAGGVEVAAMTTDRLYTFGSHYVGGNAVELLIRTFTP